MKILAVDDEPSILELLTMIAARAGFKNVSTAFSGELALEILKHGDTVYDCLIFDINMPGIDGVELCEMVRTIPDYCETPIIILTAMAEKDYIDRAFKAGATDYASKPFDIVELNARLRMVDELVIARQNAARAGSKENAERRQVRDEVASSLSDRIEISGVKNLIEYVSLENYVSQLSRAGLRSSQVLAVKVDRIDAIYARASSDEFIYALTEVADAISDIMRATGFMMAYAGNGTFVVVSNGPALEPSIDLENEIQSLLDEKNSEYDDGSPMDIEVSIGNSIRPNAGKSCRIRMTFERAIARAESRLLRKRDEPRSVNIRLVGD